jgi:hypothetical protein
MDLRLFGSMDIVPPGHNKRLSIGRRPNRLTITIF